MSLGKLLCLPWGGGDIARRRQLEVMAESDEFAVTAGVRERDRRALLALLAVEALLPAGWSIDDVDRTYDFALCAAVHRLCARSASRWVLLQLEDLQMMADPVDIPGTHRRYPNWRRKQAKNTADIFATEVRQLLESLPQ